MRSDDDALPAPRNVGGHLAGFNRLRFGRDWARTTAVDAELGRPAASGITMTLKGVTTPRRSANSAASTQAATPDLEVLTPNHRNCHDDFLG